MRSVRNTDAGSPALSLESGHSPLAFDLRKLNLIKAWQKDALHIFHRKFPMHLVLAKIHR
jgi:hypothetical protein